MTKRIIGYLFLLSLDVKQKETMKETIFNLFYYSNNYIITEVGVVAHSADGNDEMKQDFLKKNVKTDFLVAKKYTLPSKFQISIKDKTLNGIDFETYSNLSAKGFGLSIFEDILNTFNASENPMVMITPVKDNNIHIEGEIKLEVPTEKEPDIVHITQPDHWFYDYINEGRFNLEKLINDDFIEAVRILYNAKQYVSSMKLFLISIDTIAFLEYGDINKNFQLWLEKYADLKKLNITPDELWEFRNSILHMSNLNSRKVLKGTTKRLSFIVGEGQYPKETDVTKYFRFYDLLTVISEGVYNWGTSYNSDKDKFGDFTDRYNTIISDNRQTIIRYK